ncbi:MAG TPA: twin-arginine translocase TatA/TatE family subunit [Candidatus Didemnitutus sp.]|nr:twin-arginine translocase TatA/TatE family subunit [Candidatus Didemnitutus sp.]
MSLHSLPIAGLFGLGGTELLVILFIILLLFGGAKLPALAKGLGQSVREFKKASQGDEEDEKKSEKKSEAKTGNN